MAVSLKLSYFPKPVSIIVNDDTKALTLDIQPEMKFVMITPTATVTTDQYWRNLMGVGV